MIELDGLSFSYKKQSKMLFRELNLSIKTGGIYGLLGKNGAGKSTLLKIISGLLFANQGDCKVLGNDPSARQPLFLQNIFYLPEEAYVPDVTIKKFLSAYAIFYPKFDRDFFNSCLSEFDLPTTQALTQFSYGQKKKFLFAFGLATNCRLYLLDEPTNGLDIPSKSQFRRLLASTISNERLFIVSTHQAHDIENIIDSVIILDNGNIVMHADINTIMKCLSFGFRSTISDINSYLYTEKGINGYKVIEYNHAQADSNIDLEALFNGILTNKEIAQQVRN